MRVCKVDTRELAERLGVPDKTAERGAFMAKISDIFASDASGERLGFSKIKARLDREIKRLLDGNDSVTDIRSIAPWRFHDLRRSLATGLQRQGARFEVIEAILNHKSGERSGVAGVYQRYGWHEEMRVTLEDWGAHIDKIVAQFAPKKAAESTI